MSNVITLSDRELHTTLAALRLYQKLLVLPEEIAIIATNEYQVEPLEYGEIDDLCERINTSEEQRGS